MSISNPFSQTYGWKVDPDGRQDRGNGPVITRKMTIEEKIKYGVPVESEDVKMVHMTKETVRRMAASGMTQEEIVEYFIPAYPNMKKSLIIAKVKMYLSDKKPGKKKKEEPKQEPDTMPEADGMEETDDSVVKVSAESAEKIKLKQMVDEMMELVPDNIDRPAHYTAGGIETIDYIQAKLTPEQFEGFCIGAVIKYVSRYRLKGGLEDLKKAAWYLAKIISVKESA